MPKQTTGGRAPSTPTIVRDPELAAVLAELQRASACLIRIEELLNKPIPAPPAPPAPPDDWDSVKGGIPRVRNNRNWGWWWYDHPHLG